MDSEVEEEDVIRDTEANRNEYEKDGFVVGDEEDDILNDSDLQDGDIEQEGPVTKLVGFTKDDREIAEKGRIEHGIGAQDKKHRRL